MAPDPKPVRGEHRQGPPSEVATGAWYCRNCGQLVDIGDSRHGCAGGNAQTPLGSTASVVL